MRRKQLLREAYRDALELGKVLFALCLIALGTLGASWFIDCMDRILRP